MHSLYGNVFTGEGEYDHMGEKKYKPCEYFLARPGKCVKSDKQFSVGKKMKKSVRVRCEGDQTSSLSLIFVCTRPSPSELSVTAVVLWLM